MVMLNQTTVPELTHHTTTYHLTQVRKISEVKLNILVKKLKK